MNYKFSWTDATATILEPEEKKLVSIYHDS